MKNYQEFSELKLIKTRKNQLDELRLFQNLLRSNAELNELYCGKAFEVAHGIQPWIDALEITLKNQ
mgnify:CR=1 FL=1